MPHLHASGKREQRSAIDQAAALNSKEVLVDRSRLLLDFLFAQLGEDERPYLQISIFGQEMLGLLDSGASQSLLGKKGWDQLVHLKLPIQNTYVNNCTVATGDKCPVIGSISVPICLQGKVKIFELLIVPALPHTLILGIDFWKRMELVPNLRSKEWHFCEGSEVQINSITTMSELSKEQSSELNQLIDEVFQKMGSKLGCTNLVQHRIKTSAEPIRQRYYPVSPTVQQHIDRELGHRRSYWLRKAMGATDSA